MMIATEALFRQDSYLQACQATVVAVDSNQITLDQTVFYPLGGGQPGDSGYLENTRGERIKIIDTRKGDHDTIVHLTDSDVGSFVIGEKVTAQIDWAPRYQRMRLHTCLHLLGAVVARPVTGGNIAEGYARLDFDLDTSPDKEELTQQLNELIQKDTVLNSSWITDEEMLANMDLVKTMSVKPPMGVGKVRLIEIPYIDLQPCGGTHVKSTAEIGEVFIKKIEKKGKLNRRIKVALVQP
jgi:misacylated tRNA(Ala) deacylase